MAEHSGFTLVELMVVIAIVLVLLLVAVPAFTDLIDRARVRGAAGAAMSLLSEARGAGVFSSRDVRVVFQGSDPAWCIGANGAVTASPLGTQAGAAPTCDCTTANSCTVLNGVAANAAGLQTLQLSSADYNGVTMGTRPSDFFYDGRFGALKDLATTPSVVFTSPKGKYQIQLTVAPLGQPSLCTPSGQPVIPGISSC